MGYGGKGWGKGGRDDRGGGDRGGDRLMQKRKSDFPRDEMVKMRKGLAEGLVHFLTRLKYLKPQEDINQNPSEFENEFYLPPEDSLVPEPETSDPTLWSCENFSDVKWPTVLCIGDKRVCNLQGNFLGGPPDSAIELPSSITWEKSIPVSHLTIIEKLCGGGPQMEFAVTDENKDSLKTYVLDPLSQTNERVLLTTQGMVLACNYVPAEGKINVYVCSADKYSNHLKNIAIPEKPQLFVTLEALAETVCGTDRLVARDGVSGLLKIAANDYETTILTAGSELTADTFSQMSTEDFRKFKVVSCALPLAYFANNKIKKYAKDLTAFNPASCAGLAPFVILDPYAETWPEDQQSVVIPGDATGWSLVLANMRTSKLEVEAKNS